MALADTLDGFLTRTIPEPNTGCILWTGPARTDKYGNYQPSARFRGITVTAYRIAWVLAFGDIPPEKCVCHRCDTPLCVNPDHLFLGTHAENMADMRRKGRDWKPETPKQCGNGHAYSEANTRWYRGRQQCRQCQREWKKRHYTPTPLTPAQWAEVRYYSGLASAAARAANPAPPPTHCRRGHPFSPENTLQWSNQRRCRTCRNARQIEQIMERAVRVVSRRVAAVA